MTLRSQSPHVRLGVGAFVLVGALAGLFPAIFLNLTELRPALEVIYLVSTFFSSAGVVAVAFSAGLAPEPRVGVSFTLTMMFVGALNGGFAAILQGALSREWDFVLVMGMFGFAVGLALGFVYAAVLWPGLRALREVVARPTLHDGVWVRFYVSVTWMDGGSLLYAGALAASGLSWLEPVVPHALAAGVLCPGVCLFVVTAWQRRELARVASGAHPEFERVTVASVGDVAEGLPRLHPWVSDDADHVAIRLVSQDEGPYRASTTGEPYARVD